MPNGTNQWIPNTPWTSEAVRRANETITRYLSGQGAGPGEIVTTNMLTDLLRYSPALINTSREAYDPLWFQKYLRPGSVLSPQLASALTSYLGNIAEATGINPAEVLQQYKPSFSLAPNWQSYLESPLVGLAQATGYAINPFTGAWEQGRTGSMGLLGGANIWEDFLGNLSNVIITAFNRAIEAVTGGKEGGSPK